MQIHMYLVHYDEDMVGEDAIRGRVVMYHGYDIGAQVCDDCFPEFEAHYSGRSWKYGGVIKSWACCNFCGVVVLAGAESEPEPPQESKQLEFDWG